MNDFYLVRKNLFRRKLRATLLIVTIFFSFLIYTALATFNKAMNAGIDLSASNRLIVVNKINFTQPLPISYYARVQQVPGVKKVTHNTFVGGYIQEPKNFVFTVASDQDTWLDVMPEFIVPDEGRKTFLADRQGALVGRAIANEWGWKVGDRVPVGSRIFQAPDGSQTWDVTVRAIFDGGRAQSGTNAIVLHYDYLNEGRRILKDMLGWMVLVTDDPSVNDAVMKRIDAMFANSPFETRTTTESAFNKAFLEQLGSISLIVGAVVSAAFATMLMIVGNTMFLSIRERTKEIAVLKTIGFSSARIFKMVLAETFLLSFAGGIPAIAVMAVGTVLARPLLESSFPSFIIYPEVIAAALGWMCALALVTGAIPAFHAVRINIQKGLSQA